MNLFGIDKIGITNPKAVYRNLDPDTLTEKAVERGEGRLSKTGAVVVTTGKYTGRSPKDRFIVDVPSVHDDINWGSVNMPTTRETYLALREKVVNYLQEKEIFLFDGYAGADPKYTLKFRVINELAHQNLFIRNLLIRPSQEELESYGDPDFTVIAAPGFKCDPNVDGVNSEAAIMLDFERKEILIAGSGYCGEIKKSIFSTMNYMLTKRDVLPMHCSANIDPKTGDTAVFFGLSGTGKTTLSADASRNLIGDDEHGWSPDGVFNIEGGCYAKCINLSEESEPVIYHAIKSGAVVENVIMNDEGEFDFADNSLTDNTRVGYPIEFVPNAQIPSTGGIPKVVIFLTADAFGVLPPISKLSRNAAMYHFVTGFTSKVAGTERGITEPTPTFSTLFGEPFMPMDPHVYADMLGSKLDKYGTQVYLVNTGWSGGKASDGAKRIKLKLTRAMVDAALSGELVDVEYKHHPVFNIDFPVECPGVPSEILNPREMWADRDAYDETAAKLAGMFVENFSKKYPDMPDYIVEAGPVVE